MRRAKLQVLYGGKDVSSDIAPYLISFTYTDNAHGKADTISLALEDKKGRFVGEWFPAKGARIEAVIVCTDWFAPGDTVRLNCGAFEVDGVSFDGPPDQLTIDAVSAATTSSIRREKKTKAHENTTLKDVAGGIAKAQGLKLVYESDDAVSLGRVDQRGQSDLEFLQRQAEAHGLKLKVSDDQLVLFDDEAHDAKAASHTIKRADGSLVKYRMRTQSHDTYDGAKATYWSPEEKELYAVESAPKHPPKGTGQTLAINERFESQADAQKQANKRLRAKNKGGTTASLELKGHPGMQAGLNVGLSGFGRFDGKYAIETASHKVAGQGGYATSLECKAVLASDGGEADDGPDFTPEERKLYAVESGKKTAATSATASATTASATVAKAATVSEMAADPAKLEAGTRARYQEAVAAGDTTRAEAWKKYALSKGFRVEG